MPPKRANSTNPWNECESCGIKVLSKDSTTHQADCPPDVQQTKYDYIKDGVLYGTGDVKVNEEIKGVSAHDRDNLVFLSQSVVQLCELSIGETALVEHVKENVVYARVVWPTQEKTLSSVLFTKNCVDICNLAVNSPVKVSKIGTNVPQAKRVSVIISNAPKSMDLSPELNNRLHKSHLERIVSDGNILGVLFYGKMLKFEVRKIEGADLGDELSTLSLSDDERKFYRITEKTVFDFFRNKTEYTKQVKTSINPFSKIGGLNDEINELNELINSVLGRKRTIQGFRATRAALLYGNSGTGKTLLVNAIATSTSATVVRINAADLYGKMQGNPEENVRNLFKEAKEQAPSLIVMEEVEMLCPARTSRLTDSEKRVAACVLVQIDEIVECEDEKVFILGTSNKLESLDVALRRCGRLEREIEIPVPNPKARSCILKKILGEADYPFLEEVAFATHGFVGADLLALCSRAALKASHEGRGVLEHGDFKYAMTRVRPSAMREVQVEVPNVKWRDIGGQDNLKLILKQCVEWPLKHSESFIRLGVTPPRGVLMYGPPGCSKTMIAKALATESGLNFLSIKGPELFSKWVGESERAVREVFRKARQVAPSIVFFDEIDALGGERSASSTGSSSVQERVLAQLLTELDGVTPLGDVTILAATNRPDRIDKALLRPGRLDRIVYVGLPDDKTRDEIFRIKFERMPVEGVTREDLVQKTKGYSGAEVNAVCHEAAMAALEDSLDATAIKMCHFDKALSSITPRTPNSLLKIYDDYRNKQSAT